MVRSPFLVAAALASATVAPPAAAQHAARVAAEQLLDETRWVTSISPGGQRFAQTFALPAGGSITHLMLPIWCAPTDLVVVEIVDAPGGVPSGNVLAQKVLRGDVLDGAFVAPNSHTPRMVEFGQPPLLARGQYAFTVRQTRGGACGLHLAPPGDHYTGGASFVASGGGGWYSEGGSDLVFQVFYRPIKRR